MENNKKKTQFLRGSHRGHDILVRLDEVLPFARITEIPEEIKDNIFWELEYGDGGKIDWDVMVGEDEFVRVKGSWEITIHPENLSERIQNVRKSALEYIIQTIKPGSEFQWPEENELIEWNSESGGVHEGEVESIMHKNEGNVQVLLFDEDDQCMKEVNLSDFTTDGLIRITQCIYAEKGNNYGISPVFSKAFTTGRSGDSRMNAEVRCERPMQKYGTDLYVLVEFPNDTSYFEVNDVGYPSFDSKDNGARYVSENDYLEHFKKKPKSNSYFQPLSWPESQPYLFPDEPNDSVHALSEPIGDEKGIADFGSNAVWVPLCNLK